MRYYLFKIFYNKVAQAEDRPAPVGYDTIDAAEKAFHQYLGQSIGGETCGWVLCMVVNSNGNTEMLGKWTAPVEPEPEPEEDYAAQYESGELSLEQLKRLVADETLTKDEYTEITGKRYVALKTDDDII